MKRLLPYTENGRATDGPPYEFELTILMPCLNEAETLGICIEKAMTCIERNGWAAEVLIADNGSTDGSIEIAHSLGARVVHVPIRGYGAALRFGIEQARGRWVIMGDSDDSYDFGSLERFVEKLREGHDLVMGNRFRGGIEAGAMPVLHRFLGNPVLSFIGRLFYASSIGDFHCGLRSFSRDRMRDLKLQSTGMEFASEMIVRSSLAKFRIAEIPTTLKRDGRSRPPHLNTWRDGWRHLKFLLMYSPRWLFVIPGTMLVTLGLMAGTAIFIAPLRLGNIALDLNSFLVCCFMCLVGVQLIATGAIAQQYACRTGFLPRSPAAEWLDRWLTTEHLVIFAGTLMFLGVTIFFYALWLWALSDFGPLTNPLAPRAVASGLTVFTIGLQLLFSAFIVGILQIPSQTTRVVQNE